MKSIRSLLEVPQIYQLFQESGGFFGARVRFLRKHGPDLEGATIIDVGCGPGYLRRHLPDSATYFGFDTNRRYIDFATKHKEKNAIYFCEIFDASSIDLTGPADVILMHGLLHHIDDITADNLLRDAVACLKPGGVIITSDGCYHAGQSKFREKMLDSDRGEFVRNESGYLALFKNTGLKLSTSFNGEKSWVPYDFLWITAQK